MVANRQAWPGIDIMTVLVPTRGRPEVIQELTAEFAATATEKKRIRLRFIVDESDDRVRDYRAAERVAWGWDLAIKPKLWVVPSSTMVQALNMGAMMALSEAGSDVDKLALMFMGDDHRPRTIGWDYAYINSLGQLDDVRGAGMVYGDDTIQGVCLPTQIAMTANIVRALGWMAPPQLVHLYVDNFWLDLGNRLNVIQYLPDIVIEHVHPVKTGAWTSGHVRVNTSTMNEVDRQTYERLTSTAMSPVSGTTFLDRCVERIASESRFCDG